MTPPDDDREQRLADLLADYEARLAAGGFATPQGEVRSAVDTLEESHRLESAKACLLRLERIWPHGKPLDDDLPRAIDRFEVISELGRGGFGIVYLARDAKMGRLVALKVQRPETLLSASLRQRFVREARAAARLSHPHIAGVYEVGEAGMRVWIASEYVADGPLSAWLREGRDPVAPKAAARLLSDLADALTCAHRLGVLHRDLKPSNVLLQRSTDSEPAPGMDDAPRSSSRSAPDTRAADLCDFAPKLIDFGLAKLDEGTRHETRTGALIGTPPYMAPNRPRARPKRSGQPRTCMAWGRFSMSSSPDDRHFGARATCKHCGKYSTTILRIRASSAPACRPTWPRSRSSAWRSSLRHDTPRPPSWRQTSNGF